MMTYGGIFEALVENRDLENKSGKYVFKIRGKVILLTLLLDNPEEVNAERTPCLKLEYKNWKRLNPFHCS
jgi:hypothetical protein